MLDANSINFTKQAIENLPPASTRTQYRDTKTPGLILRVTPAGTKTFALYRRIDGKPERVTLGKFPAMTVEQARKEAAKLNGKVASGENPAAEHRTVRHEITLGEMFDEFMERHARPHKASWQTDQSLYDSHLSPWKNRKLSAVTRSDVQKLHHKIGSTQTTKTIVNKDGRKQVIRFGGKGAANHVVRLLKTVYSKAILWGWSGNNPAHGIKEYSNRKRDRFLEAHELPLVFKALIEEPNETARDFFLVALFTGARRDNVLKMRWDQINTDQKTWRIPQTKNGDPHVVPLVPAVADILERRKEVAEAAAANTQDDAAPAPEWVFPGTGRGGHFASPNNAWQRIVRRSGITDPRGTTIHDLRRSLGSWQAATGANLSIIGKTLNHKNVSTTAIYARLNIDPVRESMEKAATAMLKAGGLFPPAGKVVNLKQGAGE